MNGIGALLKQVRLERHITLEEIEEATKIRIKYLQAIEDEQFDLLPGAVYAKGFVNTYIRYLNIGDQPEVVEIMRQTSPVVTEPIQAEEVLTERSERHKSRSASHTRLEDKPITSKKYLIIGISIAAIIALLVIQMLYNRQRPEEDEGSLVPPDQVTEPVNPAPEGDASDGKPEEDNKEPEPLQTTYTGVNLQLEIVDLTPSAVDKCWMTVTADGKTVFTETLSEGAAKTITADKSVYIKAGNGGVVKLTLNGQDLGTMGEKGQVVEKTFTLEDTKTVNDTASADQSQDQLENDAQ